MYEAHLKYIFGLLLSLKVPFATSCPSKSSRVDFNQFGLFLVSGMIRG